MRCLAKKKFTEWMSREEPEGLIERPDGSRGGVERRGGRAFFAFFNGLSGSRSSKAKVPLLNFERFWGQKQDR